MFEESKFLEMSITYHGSLCYIMKIVTIKEEIKI